MDIGITLSKVLPLLVYPLNLSLGLAVLGLLLAASHRRRAAAWVGLVAVAVLWIASTPVTATYLLTRLERTHPPVAADAVPKSDAIVLLGGGLGLPLPPRFHADLNDSADRILYTARLFRAGVAPRVIVSGGNVFPQTGVHAESHYTAQLLTEWGVPADAILTETSSRTTYENAVRTKQLLMSNNLKRVVLVTSGFHMPRALAVFKSAGIQASPAISDVIVVQYEQPNILRWVPSAAALDATTLALKEYLGVAVYRWRGWIR
ncbi:MAG: YdcF family protein [Gammaproteobacteria bacterium]|nr:YdcF family protein [Gammaproteobacteria bacterium]